MSNDNYKHYRKNDPFRERELEKYEDPLPSREYIMQCLDECGEPLPVNVLITAFALKRDQHDAMRRRLSAMEREAQVIRNRRGKYALVGEMDLIRGRVIGHKEGFGFLHPDDGTDDLFISVTQMRAVFPNDVVLARPVTNARGKRDAVILEVLEQNTQHIVGRYTEEKHVAFVQPHHKDITQDILIPADEKGNAQNGQYVTIELTAYPTARRQATGRVVEILGDHLSPGLEIEVALRAHYIPHIWPAAVQQEIKSLTSEVTEADKKGRKDLRELALVTIDGADAKDFDDAVYCEILPDKNFRLVVAIADVSHYVKPGSALDQEAYLRGTSVYFPGRVIPMLPEVLSNELCSLKPQVDRLCMVCDMKISPQGDLIDAEFYDAVMRSRARLIYEDVWAMLQGEKTTQMGILPHLKNLHKLYKKLLAKRQKRGALDFDTLETRIVFGKNQKIQNIVPVHRTEAHRLIEECMLMANFATAQFVEQSEMPCLYRVHEGPNPTKLKNLQDLLKGLGLTMPGKDKPTPKIYQNLLKKLGDRPDAHLIETVLLRSLMQATYTPDNKGHFGLAYETYTHFTSPIRRYPDLLVHRTIRQALLSKKKMKVTYDHPALLQIGSHCSTTERRADGATRDATNWLKCYYMKDKVGETFKGTISGVTPFGVFVELKDIYVEGLVHITALREDYYQFDPVKHQLRGKRTNTLYSLGDTLQVRLVRANLDESMLELDLGK